MACYTSELIQALEEAEHMLDWFFFHTATKSEYGWNKEDDESLEFIRDVLDKSKNGVLSD